MATVFAKNKLLSENAKASAKTWDYVDRKPNAAGKINRYRVGLCAYCQNWRRLRRTPICYQRTRANLNTRPNSADKEILERFFVWTCNWCEMNRGKQKTLGDWLKELPAYAPQHLHATKYLVIEREEELHFANVEEKEGLTRLRNKGRAILLGCPFIEKNYLACKEWVKREEVDLVE